MRSDEIPKIDKFELDVPRLGNITGLSLNGTTCQYLGIPYAEVPGRFTRSIPARTPWETSHFDGTKLGYVELVPTRNRRDRVSLAQTEYPQTSN